MARELFIIGKTADGQTFRPSDWAERLCGVLACYRPGGVQKGDHLAYSPYAKPLLIDGTKCVAVDERLNDLEPLAWQFVLNFARDNGLQLTEACSLPDKPDSDI